MTIDEKIEELYNEKKYDQVIDTVDKYIKNRNTKLNDKLIEKYFICLSYYGLYDKMIKYLKFKESKPYEVTKDPYKNIKSIGECIEKYIVNESILMHYYVELLKIGKFEEANNVVKKIKLLYPNYLDNFLLTCLMIRCNNVTEAKKLISISKFNGNQLIKIAGLFVMLERYNVANSILDTLKNKNYEFKEKEEQLDRLLKIKKNKNCFIKMRYEYFKLNHSLRPGDIIYTRFVDDKYASKYDGYKDRPFMIWKIENDNIYAFPVSARIPDKSRKYIIHHQDYLNIPTDRTIKDNLTIIKERDVQNVLERLRREDYKSILSNLYSGLLICKDDTRREEMKPFMDEYFDSMNIRKESVIAGFNKEENKAYQYIVIGEDKENYFGIRVKAKQNNIVLMDTAIESLNKRKEVLRVVPLTQHNIEQVNTIYKKVKELGKIDYKNLIIEKKGKQYKVISQDNQRKILVCETILDNKEVVEINFRDDFNIVGKLEEPNKVLKKHK